MSRIVSAALLGGCLLAAAATSLAPTTGRLLLSLGSPDPATPPAPALEPVVRAEELFDRLPPPARQRARQVADDHGVVPLGRGIAVSIVPPARALFTGHMSLARGPVDHGLETIASLAGGRLHESLIALESGDAMLVKSACLASFGFADGTPAGERDERPPRGVPLRVEVRWCDDEGVHHVIDASCLIRDRRTDRGLPPLPFVWTGSRMGQVSEPDGKGGVREAQAFLLAMGRVAVANLDCDDALIASPLPAPADLLRWEVNTALAPPLDHPVALVLSRAVLPIGLRLDPAGELTLAGGVLLDDGALGVRLAAAFAQPAPGTLHAVRVCCPSGLPREADVAARARILRAAARVGVWCVPVFEPDGTDPGPEPRPCALPLPLP